MADTELMNAFLLESVGILESLDRDLECLEQAEDNKENINSIFRGIHTIKGNSSFLDLEKITRVSHVAESLLDLVRKEKISVDSEMIQLLQNVISELKCLVQGQYDSIDINPTVSEVEIYQSSRLGKKSPAQDFAPKKLEDQIPARTDVEPKKMGLLAAKQFVRLDETKVNNLISLVNELELLRYSFDLLPEKLEKITGTKEEDFRFDVDFMISKLSRVTKSLGGITFGIKLVPVNQVFQRFPKVVTDMANKLGKKMELVIQNGDAELDKSIVEAIADPMTHLIRNSADHGIESPAERVLAGKSPTGKILLNSYVDGNFVYIEIKDDGRGIDGDKILRKAIEKQIVPKDNSDGFTEAQKLALIFAPGFSTAEQITDFSGRGVGMDVVKSNINRLKGTVLIDSEVGIGTTIRLRFPMSMAVLLSLIVDVRGVCCGISMSQIEESIDYLPQELLNSPPVEIEEGTKIYSVYSLREILWGEKENLDSKKIFHLIRFSSQKGANISFIVDDFISIEEAIVQSVDSYISALPGIQGATLRKDGTVALYLNTSNLIDLALRSNAFAYVKRKKIIDLDQISNNLSDFLEVAK